MAVHQAVCVQEWSGMATSAVLDKVASSATASQVTAVTTGTTPVAGFSGTALVIACAVMFKAETFSGQTAGYTIETINANISMEYAYQSAAVTSGTTTETFSCTASSSGRYAAAIASFVASGTPALVHDTTPLAANAGSAFSLGFTPAAGNLLVGTFGFDSLYISQVIDNTGQKWAQATIGNVPGGGAVGQLSIWYAQNTGAGVTTVTLVPAPQQPPLIVNTAVARGANF